jgi:hypothetical protein
MHSITAEAIVKEFEATEGNATLREFIVDSNLKWVHVRVVTDDKLV